MKFQTNDVVIVSKKGYIIPVGRIGRVYKSNEYSTIVCFENNDCFVGDKKVTYCVQIYYSENGVVKTKTTKNNNFYCFENEALSPYTGNAECKVSMFFYKEKNGRRWIME